MSVFVHTQGMSWGGPLLYTISDKAKFTKVGIFFFADKFTS